MNCVSPGIAKKSHLFLCHQIIKKLLKNTKFYILHLLLLVSFKNLKFLKYPEILRIYIRVVAN